MSRWFALLALLLTAALSVAPPTRADKINDLVQAKGELVCDMLGKPDIGLNGNVPHDAESVTGVAMMVAQFGQVTPHQGAIVELHSIQQDCPQYATNFQAAMNFIARNAGR